MLMLYNSKQKKQNRHEIAFEIVANTAEAIRDEILKIIKTHDEINSPTKRDGIIIDKVSKLKIRLLFHCCSHAISFFVIYNFIIV